MEERITAGAAVKAAGRTLIPLVSVRLERRKIKRGFFISGHKQPLAVIIVTPSARRAFKLDGQEVPLAELAGEYPGARGIINAMAPPTLIGDGMDEKQQIFDRIREQLSAYVPPLTVKSNTSSHYETYGATEAVIGKRVKKGVFFASVIIQRNYVGLYFFPIYTHPQEFAALEPGLKKLLKGKSCFHIRQYDDLLSKHIQGMLKKGFEIYRKNGWV
jgi:hypothetical protein